MEELTGRTLFVCTKCERMFVGSPEEGDTPLPCGHSFNIASNPLMCIREMVLADQVWDLVGEDIEHSKILETLEARIND